MSLEDTVEVDQSEASEVDTSERAVESDVDGLGNRLHRIREYSDGESVVGEIDDIEEGEESVTFVIEHLTTDDRVRETMAIPHPWNERSKLALLLDKHGYDPSSIDMMVGEEVELVERFGEWRVVNPAKERLFSSLNRVAVVGGLVVFGTPLLLTGLIALLTEAVIPLALATVVILPLALLYFGLLYGLRRLF